MKYEFEYNCVAPDNYDELCEIIDHLDEDIPYDEFVKEIPFDNINDVLGGIYPDEEMLRNDWHVRFFIDDVEFEGEQINYAVMVHSAIEYVWKMK